MLTHSVVFDDCIVLSLEGRGDTNHAERLRVIEPCERTHTLATPRPRRVKRQAAMRAAWLGIANARPQGGLWTAAAARIDLWPYQLEPALSALRGSTRLLLADDVGLGKTIQASLLLAELRARGWVARALVLCPAGLREAWLAELTRFGIEAAIFDQASIAERIALAPPGVNPWVGTDVAIASIDFAKRPEILASLGAVPIDLLIVDEAHHVVPGTDRGAAVHALASRSPWCVLVSATPHSGDAAAFGYLCATGDMRDTLTVFRRSRADVGIASSRRTHVLTVTPTPEERALLTAVDNYTTAIWRGLGRNDHAVRLVAITLARRAASSVAAIARSLIRRHALLTASASDVDQPVLPWADEDRNDDIEPDALLSKAGLADAGHERTVLERLIALATACRVGAKLRRLARMLDRIREPAIVFTEYRDSLDEVIDHLQPQRAIGAIHGGLPTGLRRSIVDRFNNGEIDLLVATDTAGEGLNLHHRCRLVIDLELPWNPMRLEQRIGRVDRLGQRRTVHAIHCCSRGSVEARVLDRLQWRRRNAASAFSAPVAEMDLARAVFDGQDMDSLPVGPVGTASLGMAREEATRLRRQRLAGRDARRGTVWSKSRTHRPAQTVAVVRDVHTNDAGVIIGEEVSAYRLDLKSMPGHDREWRGLLAHVGTVASAAGSSLDRSSGQQMIDRIAAIRVALAGRASMPYQGSLFDARAEHAAAIRRNQAATLQAALDRILRQITPQPAGSRVEVIAAWPEA